MGLRISKTQIKILLTHALSTPIIVRSDLLLIPNILLTFYVLLPVLPQRLPKDGEFLEFPSLIST